MKSQRIGYMLRRLGVDVLLLSASLMAAFLIHFEGKIPLQYRSQLPRIMLFTVGIMLLGFLASRSYRKVSDFVSLGDFLSVLKGVALAALTLICANTLAPKPLILPWSLLTIYLLLSTATMAIALFTLRIWREAGPRQAQRAGSLATRRPIIIYGAGRAGSTVARDIQQSPELGYTLIGFIDDDAEKWGMEIHGATVLGGRHDLPRFLGPNTREVVLAIPSLDAEGRREILSHCRRVGSHVRIIPGLAELLRENSFAHQIRDVRVEDLLPREAVELDESEVRELLAGETVLVTGAAGSIGSELCQQILRHEPAVLLLVEQSESRLFYLEMELERVIQKGRTRLVPIVADICNGDRIEALLRQYRPTCIFHAAAYKHVPMMEKNPQEAIRNNVFATLELAKLANKYEVERFTLVSTDKAVEPTSVMGASKRAAELVVQELQHGSKTRFLAVRFGNVLDSDGSVVPLFKKQIAEGGPITITHPDMERFFMTIPEAARLILQASAMGEGGEVFVLEMGKPVRVLDLARSLVELSGLHFMEDIQVKFSGIRPGEKLSEKLFFDHERSLATKSRQIYRARLENGQRLDLDEFIRDLQILLRTSPNAEKLARRFMTLVSGLDARKPAVTKMARKAKSSQVVPIPQVVAAGR